MEEEKAAAYYDELTRKGGGAARFKQGLGFSSTDGSNRDAVPAKGSALPSSSFLSSFVRASSPSKSSGFEKQAQIESIQNKLKKKQNSSSSSSRVHNRGRESDRQHSSRHRRGRNRSKDDEERTKNHGRQRSNSRDRDRYRDRDRDRGRRKRSISGSDDDDDRKTGKGKTLRVDYAKSIIGYNEMTPAERVKAKMKLQLSATIKQDEANGMGSGWERFNFDKDAPLDDEDIEAAEDDGALVKRIGQTFRFSAVEAKRVESIEATHDEAIFGTSSLAPPVDTDSEADVNNCITGSPETAPVASLISDQVRSLKQGSWRDRINKA